jgi:predicted nucleotidyltransferase
VIPELSAKIADVSGVCREFGVLRLEVFGSAATGDWDPVCSDFDFLVTYPAGWDYGGWLTRHFDFEERLALALGRPVDLVIAKGRYRNPYFDAEVQRTRQVVFDAAEGAG